MWKNTKETKRKNDTCYSESVSIHRLFTSKKSVRGCGRARPKTFKSPGKEKYKTTIVPMMKKKST